MMMYARLVAAALTLAVMATTVVINQGYIEDATVKTLWNTMIVAKHIEIINGTCPTVEVGPFASSECIRQVGEYYVAYLPGNYTVRVEGGWVVGLFKRLG
jgi:K+-transporting ATPase A subunit